ncbi:MAG TPA: shikimate dehydrogenase [Anaerolineales bacterium]|nr:shikimate dehydrogenase [Anaerolineales bacterium]HNS61876.1 shikimate dehydrogenase [Anaerolineales bacterium]
MQRLSTFDFRLGLIGYPLSHSLSPQIHTAALKSCGLAGDYSLFPILPEDKQELHDLLTRLRTGELHGLNVTVPHKQTVIEFLDELTPTAQAIGAVNTIYLRDNKLIGDNTDAAGFSSDLNKFLAAFPSPAGRGAGVREKSSIVLGAGGSARAVVYALLQDGWNVTISARRIEQAQELATSFTQYAVRSIGFTNLPLSTFHLIVNTTPLGMTPTVEASPFPENLSLPSNAFIYDLVYNPRETKLVRDARQQGLHATTGLGMLIEQAALSFEIWTGHNPPREVLYNSVVE